MSPSAGPINFPPKQKFQGCLGWHVSYQTLIPSGSIPSFGDEEPWVISYSKGLHLHG